MKAPFIFEVFPNIPSVAGSGRRVQGMRSRMAAIRLCRKTLPRLTTVINPLKKDRMPILIVKANILAGRHNALRESAQTLQSHTLPEDGCIRYEPHIAGDTFILLEQWRDQASLDAHLNTAHIALYLPQIRACIEDGLLDVQMIEPKSVSEMRV
ncbi:antibiotic biosynthesis monooxygenase [Herbaspirillum sp. LeCh32-8]|uniref:putative quinol monooxygenase n=1 Tax=Herbaspirillum sp. LeCh32-8 TaxID=2821356 RepID=UPI001AE8E65F|nr:putative quinol monooxygenase [Herbaspirillum sp. LeCh32-8]MBP0598161.1 antibiotic biosynthesis monooxygenase [Herbaspirillum sp. LeCh32-8]